MPANVTVKMESSPDARDGQYHQHQRDRGRGWALPTIRCARQTDTSTIAGSTLIANAGTSITRTFSTPGTYYFMCESNWASCAPRCGHRRLPGAPPYAALDIDGNGQVDALTDGVRR